MASLMELSPEAFTRHLAARRPKRAWLLWDEELGRPVASRPDFEFLADFLADDQRDFDRHEAVFLGVGEESGALFGAFIHRTLRGQAQGGLRYWSYGTLESFLRDGLRLARGMGRKCALAGLWWGGGKGIIARRPGPQWEDPGYRRCMYGEYGRFVTSLRGCYVTAENAGTTPADMAEVYRNTRFATCVPPDVGGSGNPSAMTAEGVVCAMEAALDFLGMGPLEGKTVAMQGAGSVGSFMIERLLAKGVARITASEVSESQRAFLLDRFGGANVEVYLTRPEQDPVLGEACDILALNALGGVLGPKTIPGIRARIVCGAANNQLEDEERDARALAERGVIYVPDYIANRMGIVSCSDEHAGCLPADPAVLRHLDPGFEDSIYQVTRRVLETARSENTTPAAAANRLADERALELHPIWGHRTKQIIEGLRKGGWAGG